MNTNEPPDVVFIVPYRNRPQHKYFFLNYMTHHILPPNTSKKYEIYMSHQHDKRAFNRGAMKNIGFLAVKNKYPEHYKSITFVFNDVDTLPFASIFNYQTTQGIVKHFYGFEYALGGIVAITGADFEAVNGFPNYWGWGMEDRVLQERCLERQLRIDRNQFFPIGSPEILQLFDGVERLINPADMERSKYDASTTNGLTSISLLKYKIADGDASANKNDMKYVVQSTTPPTLTTPPISTSNINTFVYFINTSFFLTGSNFETNKSQLLHYDLRPGASRMAQTYKVEQSQMVETTDTWKNIPMYPTHQQKRAMEKQHGKERAKQITAQQYYQSNKRGRPK